MQLCHRPGRTSAAFDEPNLVSSAGLVPGISLAEAAGLRELADEHLSVPTDKGANPGLKVASLVAGMAAGADSIEDMALLRAGPRRRGRQCGQQRGLPAERYLSLVPDRPLTPVNPDTIAARNLPDL